MPAKKSTQAAAKADTTTNHPSKMDAETRAAWEKWINELITEIVNAKVEDGLDVSIDEDEIDSIVMEKVGPAVDKAVSAAVSKQGSLGKLKAKVAKKAPAKS